MGWLLDTNVLSELRRPRPDRNVVAFVTGRPLQELFVSTVTLAEIRFGIEIVADPLRRAELSQWLEGRVRPMFDGRILELDEEILLKWRLLVEDGRKTGHTFSQPDLMIAATALHHGLTVLTRDQREFATAGTLVQDPWIAQ